MKGIVLAGGTGSRLWPITKVTSKQLLPVYDKPMIYYPISTLMLAGIKEILIITTPQDQSDFKKLLGDGSQLGVNFHYLVQEKPNGLAQAFIIGENFLEGESCMMVLGDNIFHGVGLGLQLREMLPSTGAHIFTYTVSNPTDYGVLSVSESGVPIAIEEKPKNPNSDLAVTGLYYFDNRVTTIARNVKPSNRGELEITSVIKWYLDAKELSFTKLSRGSAWLDTGNPDSLHDASTFVRVIEERTGLKIGCIEEIAFRNKWINEVDMKNLALLNQNSDYGRYLAKVSSETDYKY